MFGYNSVEVREMVSRRYKLTDEQWNKIKTYFESKKGRPYKNVKNTVNGIVWIMRSGAAWRISSGNLNAIAESLPVTISSP